MGSKNLEELRYGEWVSRSLLKIGVSTYKVTTKLPAELQKYLPSPEEMAKSLEGMGNE